MPQVVLGLDLGPNSIGWALIRDDADDPANCGLIDVGVRVFPEGVDNFDSRKEKSRNEARRTARTMRRQIARRSRRRRRLRDALIQYKLWPAGSAAQADLDQLDPYELRARGLDSRLELHEIGRVILHINQRRGFKSNKKEEAKADAVKARQKKAAKTKTPKPDAEKKTEDILVEMEDLAIAIEQSGARTLGKYLYGKLKAFDHSNRVDDDLVRGRHTQRKMLTRELELIWTVQSRHHSELNDELLYGKFGRQRDIQRPISRSSEYRNGLSDIESFGLFGLIFFHRTLKPVPKDIVGLCEFEPKERRCARADRRAQFFRLLQEVNNLEYIDPSAKEPCRLDDGQRELLLDHLSTREKATFDELRDKLGFLSSIKFNLERGKRASIKGMVSDILMAKAIGKQWHKLSEEIKTGVVAALVQNVDDDETHTELTESFGLTEEEANLALGVELPQGYLKLSLAAINKLLPHMKQGLIAEHRDPTRSARAAAGYDDPWALQRRLFGKLPDPKRTNAADCPIADIPNPVVNRALVELRKVVNAIVTAHGRPDEIHIEMGRDVKTRPKDVSSPAYWKYVQEENEKAEREKRNTAAKEVLRENNIPFGAAGRNILKFLLWQEQDEVCIYSGKCISLAKLFTNEIEIDHILHRSHSLDDSPMNLAVCYRPENHGPAGKGQKTPRGWLEHSNPAKYDDVCQRAKKLPYPKYKRFLAKEVKLDDFIERQLNDTRYIAKATAEYLKSLFALEDNKRGAVLGLKGQLTSTLRRQWGLDTILEELPDSPAWQEKAAGRLRPGQKNRADHRHHAIDAVVLALTNPRRLRQLAAGFTVVQGTDRETGESKFKTVYKGDSMAPPWIGFRTDIVESIRKLDGTSRGISHRVERKISGALHDDQPFGPTFGRDLAPIKETWVKRKLLAELSAAEVQCIRDTSSNQKKRGVREHVLEALSEAGISVKSIQPKRGKPKTFYADNHTGNEASDKRVKSVLTSIAMPTRTPGKRIPVKRVRLLVQNETVKKIRERSASDHKDDTRIAYVKPNSTHHLCIFEWDRDGKMQRDAVFVTMLEAINRVKLQGRALAQMVKQWEKAGTGARKVKELKRQAMREIAKEHPIIQRDARKLEKDCERIPSTAKFVMSLSRRELLLLNINGIDKLFVFNTAASTTRQMTFYPHTAAKRDGTLFGKLTKYPNSLFDLNPRKVTVDPLGRVRWAND